MAAADDSDVPIELIRDYRADAAGLAIARYEQIRDQTYSKIELPKSPYLAYYNGLIHIFHSTEIAERDTIADLYQIHDFRRGRYQQLTMLILASADWLDSWRNGGRLTGDSYIDTLVEKYKLFVSEFYEGETWDPFVKVVLRTNQAFNMSALAQSIEYRSGIGQIFGYGMRGDGNWLTADTNDNYIDYIFSYGWGDCASGCIYRRYWTFRVSCNSGAVEYLGTSGDPNIPPP